MKTIPHFRGRSSDFFHMHPFNALFALVTSILLMFLLTLMLMLFVR